MNIARRSPPCHCCGHRQSVPSSREQLQLQPCKGKDQHAIPVYMYIIVQNACCLACYLSLAWPWPMGSFHTYRACMPVKCSVYRSKYRYLYCGGCTVVDTVMLVYYVQKYTPCMGWLPAPETWPCVVIGHPEDRRPVLMLRDLSEACRRHHARLVKVRSLVNDARHVAKIADSTVVVVPRCVWAARSTAQSGQGPAGGRRWEQRE